MSNRQKKTGAQRQNDRGGRRLTNEQQAARASREEGRTKAAAAVLP